MDTIFKNSLIGSKFQERNNKASKKVLVAKSEKLYDSYCRYSSIAWSCYGCYLSSAEGDLINAN